MEFRPTTLPDVILLIPKVFGDPRGYFMETFQARDYAAAGLPAAFVQDNQSRSRQGTLRGMHYQIRQPQGKLLGVVVGEIYDVVVDIRRSSPTFGKWEGQVLSAENKLQLWIPIGFAHGFYVLSDYADVIYKTTDFYAPQWERTVLWNDPEIGIQWPIISGAPLLLSAKDVRGVPLRQAEIFD